MALRAFADKGRRPEAAELAAVLADSAPLWSRLVTHLGESYPPITEEWAFAGAKYGWSLRIKRKDRVVLYLTPQDGSLLAGVVLGEKAVAAALGRGLSARAAALVEAAPRYAEGRGIRVEVAAEDDAAVVEELVAAKMA
jgi:hypothetical protein